MGVCIHLYSTRLGVYQPDQLHASRKILLALAGHFSWVVPCTQHFHGKIGCQSWEWVAGYTPIGYAVPGNKGNVGNAHKARSKPHHARLTGDQAQVAWPHEVR